MFVDDLWTGFPYGLLFCGGIGQSLGQRVSRSSSQRIQRVRFRVLFSVDDATAGYDV